jgi:hypothetical protein
VPSFIDAARRHERDAAHLLGVGRHVTADHLAGFAAECSIKAVLTGVGGVPTPAAGAPQAGNTKFQHLPGLWADASLYLAGLAAFASSATISLLASNNPFAQWSVSDRYEDDAVAPVARSAAHWAAARTLLSIAEQAALTGGLP